VCQCSQWLHSGKDCPPLPSPVRVQGAGHATLPCHPSLFNCHGPRHWHLALARVLAALAAQGRSNSGASDAADLSRPAGLPGVSVLSVVAQWEGLSAAPVGVKGMHPFPLLLPRTLALGSHPRPGPGSARCTGAQRLPEIQILGRVMPPSSHACQVCQWSQSPSWPSTTSCSRC